MTPPSLFVNGHKVEPGLVIWPKDYPMPQLVVIRVSEKGNVATYNTVKHQIFTIRGQYLHRYTTDGAGRMPRNYRLGVAQWVREVELEGPVKYRELSMRIKTGNQFRCITEYVPPFESGHFPRNVILTVISIDSDDIAWLRPGDQLEPLWIPQLLIRTGYFERYESDK